MRSFVTTNVALKLSSLLLAFLMWGFVASQKRGESTEIIFTNPLVLKNIPASLQVTAASVQAVSVLVQLNRSQANSINPNLFQVGIDLSNQLPGSFDYSLTERNVSYNSVSPPEGMTVLQFNPPAIPISLEETNLKEVPIRPRLSGDLARGFTIKSIEFQPPLVKVRGAQSVLLGLNQIYTLPLDVQDLRTDVEMQVNLELPAAVRLAAGNAELIQAQIKVSDNPTRLLLLDIPVIFENIKTVYKTSTSRVNVYVEGPEEAVSSLDGENVFAVIDLAKYPPGDYRGLTPKIILPDTVKVLEQWPIIDLFVINRPVKRSG